MRYEHRYLNWDASRQISEQVSEILRTENLTLDCSLNAFGDEDFYHRLYSATRKKPFELTYITSDYQSVNTNKRIWQMNYSDQKCIEVIHQDSYSRDPAMPKQSTQSTMFNVVAGDGLYEHHKTLMLMILDKQELLYDANILFPLTDKKVLRFPEWRSFDARSKPYKEYCVSNFKHFIQKIQPTIRQQSVVDILIQDIHAYKMRPVIHINRNVYDSIKCKKPFVIMGGPGILAQIKKLGYKTFDNYWDESYDNIEDNFDRIDAVCEIIKNISTVDATVETEYNYKLLATKHETI